MLRLRPYKISDAAAVLGWAAQLDRRGFYAWCADLLPYPITRGGWAAFEESVEADTRTLLWTAVTETGEAAGIFRMRRVDYEENTARVGFVLLDPALRGQGLGAEMLRLAETYAFGVLGLTTLTLGVFLHNVAAYRCYLAAGFRFSDTDYESSEVEGETYAARDMIAWRDGPKAHRLTADAPEGMRSFFAARVAGYDAHMLDEVEGCRAAYRTMAALLPETAETLLDLGCGTGLELDAIFTRFPALRVTGVDMTRAMLDELAHKHAEKALTLRCESYLESEFGEETFDAAVSAESLHHLTHGEKRGLYARVYAALKPDGVFIDCDYMVEKPEDEDFFRSELAALVSDGAGADGEAIHYDTPCTVENECALLRAAGFIKVELIGREGNTTILLARK